MRYFIYITDAMYCGLHGMFDQVVTDTTLADAIDIGRERAIELFESYEELYDNYNDIEDDDDRYDAMLGDSCIEIFRIKDDYKNLNEYQLEELAYNEGYEEFVKIYCDEEPVY